MKLEPQPRAAGQCAVNRCTAEWAVKDSTRMLDDCDVPLCNRHWEERLEMTKPQEDTNGKIHKPRN